VNGSPAVEVAGLGVREGDSWVLRDVAFSVPRASIYGILGRQESLLALMRCLTGTDRPESGRVTILGLDAGSRWRLRSRRIFVPSGADPPSTRRKSGPPDLLLLEAPEKSGRSGLAADLRSQASQGSTIVFTTRDAALAEAAADRIAILGRGRLLADETIPELHDRFRRIRYANRVTETRTEFGNELDAFDALRVRVRGWGIEALVSNFEESAFERFRRMDGIEDAVAERLSLGEIVAAVSEEK
jgi:ABC-type multidrug transport system ATPase subunit